MSQYTISAPPLQDVRETLWTLFTGNANTSGYTWMKEGRPADMPYLAIGPAYKGAGGTETDWGVVYVVIQVDAYALAKRGGSNKVSTMIEDVYAAISAGPLSHGDTDPYTITVEDDVLNTNMQDSATGDLYAQRFVRFRILVTE